MTRTHPLPDGEMSKTAESLVGCVNHRRDDRRHTGVLCHHCMYEERRCHVA